MPKEIPEHRRALVQTYGAYKHPNELKGLLNKMTPGPVQIGVVHGDLHAMNVLVRGGDAILIDFEKIAQKSPLLFDFASIEAGLFVSGYIGDTRTGPDVLDSIERLYQIDTLVQHQFSPCNPSNASAWLFDCVRQIRMQARQIELTSAQYAYILAVVLVKKACNKAIFNTDSDPSGKLLNAEQVRALAYVLGERILLELSNINNESLTE